MNDQELSIQAYNRAVAAANREDHQLELAEYNEAIRLDPHNELAYWSRAELYLDMKMWDEAITDCTTLIGKNSHDPHAYNIRGNAYLGRGEYGKAVEDHTSALVFEHEGLWDFSCFWRGLAYLKQGEFFKAIADFDRADRPHALLNELLENRAIAYDAIGEKGAAARDRNRARTRPIPPSPKLIILLQGLIIAWCTRQALGPLRWLLPSWPMSEGTSDNWRRLQQALALMRTVERKEMTNDEAGKLAEAEQIVRQTLSSFSDADVSPSGIP